MRIAIVGAGLAGLACAHELERLGHTPDILEKASHVGKRATVVETMAQFMHVHPRQDIFEHLHDDLHLPVNPANHIQKMVMHGPRHKSILTGHLGYTTLRGTDERSIENQLLRHVRSPIRFGQEPDIYALAQEYDWVVVATGDPRWARDFLQWQTDIAWAVRGAVVTGEFDPSELHFFFRTGYAGTGYAMVSPIDEHHATVGVGVPGADPVEVDRYWQVFRAGEGKRWHTEEEQFKFERLEFGSVRRCVLGNVLLVGAAGGFSEGLGLAGQCPSMTSGVCAARQVVLGDRSLERFHRRWLARQQYFHRIRRNVNAWTDREMDLLVQAVGAGGKYLAFSPWELVVPAGRLLDLLHLADDPNPDVGFESRS